MVITACTYVTPNGKGFPGQLAIAINILVTALLASWVGLFFMTLALVLGDKIKGIVALNGYVPKFVKEEHSIQSTEAISMCISHEEYDNIFPVHIGYENNKYFQ
jgi:hypothetical protein